MLEVFKDLMPYFTNETAVKIEEITKNVSGITNTQKNYLLEIKAQADSFMQQLYGLKKMGFHSLKNAEKIADELKKYKIDLSYYSHLNSELSNEKVELINKTLDEVLEKAGKAYLYFKACTETARRPIPVRKRSSCPYTKVNWYAEVPQKQHLIYLQITAFKR